MRQGLVGSLNNQPALEIMKVKIDPRISSANTDEEIIFFESLKK